MLISVIIPCYNSSDTIDRAVHSVINQTYQNWEIILVDNNSVDNTIDILQDYQKKYPGKIRVTKELKRGAPAARNNGLFVAKGEWIQFLDSDDEIIIDKFERMVQIINQNDNVDVICCESLQMSDRKQEVKIVEKDFWLGLIKSRLGITSANFFKKSNLLDINGWDEEKTSSQEYDLMFRLLKNNGTPYIYKFVTATIHISNAESISRDKSPQKALKVLDNMINLRTQIRKYLLSTNSLTTERKNAISKYIRNNIIYFLPYSKKEVISRFFKLLPILKLKDVLIVFYLMPSSLLKNQR